MATYTKVYNNPYPNGWKDGKDGNTPVTAEILNNQTETLEAIEQYLEDNPIEQGGGGSGTTDYNDLTNKPSINGTELSGDITLDIPTKTSDLKNDSGFLTDIKGKSYNDLTDKPQINGIDLQGNLTVEELGLLDITESTDTTLENSKDGVLKIKEILGNTIQDGEPTPDVPIEIKSVVISEIRSCGKNLCPINEHSGTASVWLKQTVKARKYASVGITLASGTSGFSLTVAGVKNGVKTNLRVGSHTSTVILKNIPSQGYDEVYVESYSAGADNAFKDVFIYTHDTEFAEDLVYEPYTESVVTLSEPITLNGLNGVQDYVDGKRGVLVQKFGVEIFDGSNDEAWDIVQASNYFQCNIRMTDIVNSKNAMCTHFPQITPEERGVKNGMVMHTDNMFSFALLPEMNITTVASWKTLLKSNPITVVYELAEPIETPLPDADVEALKSLKTYDGVTHIFTDSEIEPSWLLEYNTTRVGTELDEIDAELVKINKRITDIGTTAQINYSTEEQVIGTWIDGKTLYQKTYDITGIALTANIWFHYPIEIENLDCVLKIEGTRVSADKKHIYSMNGIGTDITQGMKLIYNGFDNAISFVGTRDNENVDTHYFVTLEYIKTTDTI